VRAQKLTNIPSAVPSHVIIKKLTVPQRREAIDLMVTKISGKISSEAYSLKDIDGEWIYDPNIDIDAARVLLYLHGGAYCLGSARSK